MFTLNVFDYLPAKLNAKAALNYCEMGAFVVDNVSHTLHKLTLGNGRDIAVSDLHLSSLPLLPHPNTFVRFVMIKRRFMEDGGSVNAINKIR